MVMNPVIFSAHFLLVLDFLFSGFFFPINLLHCYFPTFARAKLYVKLFRLITREAGHRSALNAHRSRGEEVKGIKSVCLFIGT